MRLNLGCGRYPAPDWVNIDAWDAVGPDLVADVARPGGLLPIAGASAQAVYAGHLFEHIAPDAVPVALAEIRRVLAPGGRFAAVGPDVDRIDPLIYPDLHRDASTGPARQGDNPHGPHLWDCTEKRMLDYIQAIFPGARAVPIADLDLFWPAVSRVWWQCAVEVTL